jgi:uncharacterized protein (DUF486 family)
VPQPPACNDDSTAAAPATTMPSLRGPAVIPVCQSLRDSSMITILLLTISNVFMTFAWYGHLKYARAPIAVAILASWLIAFPEYCFQVPANRIGHRSFEAAQLKVMQEVITLVVFAVFSVLYLKEPLRWNYIVGFVLILGAVFFVFMFPAPRAAGTETRSGATSGAVISAPPDAPADS